MKSKSAHKTQVYNKHKTNTYNIKTNKTKKCNTKTHNSNKTRKVKKTYNSNKSILHNGGGLFDSILSFGLNKRIKNFINKTKLVDTLYNSLIKYIKNDNNKLNTSILKDSIHNFIFNVLKKFYYLLKSNNSLFTGNYKLYKYKKVFKYDNDNNKFSNDIIFEVLTKFINLLLSLSNIGTSIYPLNIRDIGSYFENTSMNKSSIIDYINAIIEYDNNIISNPQSYYKTTYLLRSNNNNPKIKYNELLYIKQKQMQYSSSNKTNKYDPIFIIIYKKFSSTQLKYPFIYGSDLTPHDDFYVLENSFLNLINELQNIKPNTFKKLVKKYNYIIFNSKNANLYGEFLFYYYKSFVFSNQR